MDISVSDNNCVGCMAPSIFFILATLITGILFEQFLIRTRVNMADKEP